MTCKVCGEGIEPINIQGALIPVCEGACFDIYVSLIYFKKVDGKNQIFLSPRAYKTATAILGREPIIDML